MTIEERVCAKIMARGALGLRKYGTTMERDDLDVLAWLEHLQGELMDAAVYVEKLMAKNRHVTYVLKCKGELEE